MDVDILNNNIMEEYIRKSFVVPNAAIKVACFKAGMTEDIQTDTGRRGRRYQQVERRRCKSYELRGLCNLGIGRIAN